jgi:hypothetical protein
MGTGGEPSEEGSKVSGCATRARVGLGYSRECILSGTAVRFPFENVSP